MPGGPVTLSIVRAGILKGGGPGKIEGKEFGLNKFFYDNNDFSKFHILYTQSNVEKCKMQVIDSDRKCCNVRYRSWKHMPKLNIQWELNCD